MESKYGGKIDVISTFPFVSVGYLFLGIILSAVGIGILISALSGSGNSGLAFSIIATVVGLCLLAFSIIQLTVCNVTLYENAIAARTTFKTILLSRNDIYAIYWYREGENSVNSRAPRRNQACAEIIMRGGKTGYKMSAGFYRDLDKKLGDYQQRYKIPRTL